MRSHLPRQQGMPGQTRNEADAGIGAGLAAAVLLSAAGASAVRRQRPATR